MARLATALKAYQQNPAVAKAAVAKPAKPAKPSPVGTDPNGIGDPGAQVKAVLGGWKPGDTPAAASARAAAATPPAAAPPPVAAPLPWDANYETTVAGINLNRDNAYAGLDNEVTGVKQQYGFDDVSDPFNRLNMLERAFAQSKTGSTNSMAARGQLYSGAAVSDQGELQHGHDVNYDTLRRDYNADLGAIAGRRAAVKSGAENDTTTADWVRTQTALANRPDPATLPETPVTPATPAAKPPYKERPGKDSKGNAGVWHDYPDGRKVFVKKG